VSGCRRAYTPAEIAAFRLSDAALGRARHLLDKNEDGSLTPEEGRELDRLILLDDVIGLIQTHTASGDQANSGMCSSS
jgi:hypothetical protein